jgi:hypothetical protein
MANLEVTFRRAVAERQKWADEFPGALFGYIGDLAPNLSVKLEEALSSGREETLQSLFTRNPYLIQYAIDRSGHHGIWVFPKQMIKPPARTASKGMIPDYLVVTRSSLGYYWHIVELKRADVQFSNAAGDGYSRDGQKALAQCSRYLGHMQDYIESVRSNVRVDQVIKPVGAVVLIGDATKETWAQQQCRAEFVNSSSNIKIVSYDRLRRGLRNDIGWKE